MLLLYHLFIYLFIITPGGTNVGEQKIINASRSAVYIHLHAGSVSYDSDISTSRTLLYAYGILYGRPM